MQICDLDDAVSFVSTRLPGVRANALVSGANIGSILVSSVELIYRPRKHEDGHAKVVSNAIKAHGRETRTSLSEQSHS